MVVHPSRTRPFEDALVFIVKHSCLFPWHVERVNGGAHNACCSLSVLNDMQQILYCILRARVNAQRSCFSPAGDVGAAGDCAGRGPRLPEPDRVQLRVREPRRLQHRRADRRHLRGAATRPRGSRHQGAVRVTRHARPGQTRLLVNGELWHVLPVIAKRWLCSTFACGSPSEPKWLTSPDLQHRGKAAPLRRRLAARVNRTRPCNESVSLH